MDQPSVNDEQDRFPRLSPDDQRLLDALVGCGFELETLGLGPADRRRAGVLMSLLGLIDDYPVDDADDALVDATLARIASRERELAARMTIDPVDTGSRARRIRMPDFISIAAVVLIGASIILPVLHNLRQRSIDMKCANNMRVLSYAFGNYAADYGNEVPVAQAGLHTSWMRFAPNMINLAPLVENGYCEHGHLNCPGHLDAMSGDSYSYQWQSAGERPRWNQGRVTLLLGDRNPVIDAVRADEPIVPLALSPNHAGRGQNVLSSDGEVMWLERSVIGQGDNIWMPARGLQEGVSTDPGDVFLVH